MKHILEETLSKYGIAWCHGCNQGRSHTRGFVLHSDRKTIHLDRAQKER